MRRIVAALFLALASVSGAGASEFTDLVAAAKTAENTDAKIELYTRAIRAWTSSDSSVAFASAYRGRSWERYTKKDWAGVVEDATSSLLWDSTSWTAYHFRAWARYFLGEYADAARDHRTSANLYPTDPYLVFSEALCWNLAGRPYDARDAARRALSIDSGFVFAWTELGMAELELGELTNAERTFQRAIDLGRAKGARDAGAHVGLAMALWRQKKWEPALDELDLSFEIAKDPDAIDIWMNATRRYTKGQNFTLDDLYFEYDMF